MPEIDYDYDSEAGWEDPGGGEDRGGGEDLDSEEEEDDQLMDGKRRLIVDDFVLHRLLAEAKREPVLR